MTYELLCTAVSERADLFVETMTLLLASIDVQPSRIIVHEDVRPGSKPGAIGEWLAACGIPYAHRVTSPARNYGPAMVWLFEQASTPIVLYTQEDWRAVRAVPVADGLRLMVEHNLNQIHWNKRKTMPCKHADRPGERWDKVEVTIGGQVFCVAGHWHTQTSLWRVAPALPGLRAAAQKYAVANHFVGEFNDWMNKRYGDGVRLWNNQMMRHERLRTYIWGGIGEPKFIEHAGSTRGTGLIANHLTHRERA